VASGDAHADGSASSSSTAANAASADSICSSRRLALAALPRPLAAGFAFDRVAAFGLALEPFAASPFFGAGGYTARSARTRRYSGQPPT
jgi:hypothetical protein